MAGEDKPFYFLPFLFLQRAAVFQEPQQKFDHGLWLQQQQLHQITMVQMLVTVTAVQFQ